MIVCNISGESSEDVIYLSLTCVYFFQLLGSVVQRILAEDTAPWAGDRLIFVGDYADRLDLGDICTSEELRQFKENEGKYGGNPLYSITEDRIMCNTDELAKADPDELSGDYMRQAGALEQRVREQLTPEDLELFHRLAAIVKDKQLSAGHSDRVSVLRNLTAKKYIRDDAIANSDYAYSLGEVIAVLTIWTNDGSGTRGLDNLSEWAGRRFDIATMADVSEEGWTDVSQLAIERLRKGTNCENKMVKGLSLLCLN